MFVQDILINRFPSACHIINIVKGFNYWPRRTLHIIFQVLDIEMLVIFDSNILWRSLVFMKVECAINKAVIR